jgi:hypothetical protein
MTTLTLADTEALTKARALIASDPTEFAGLDRAAALTKAAKLLFARDAKLGVRYQRLPEQVERLQAAAGSDE